MNKSYARYLSLILCLGLVISHGLQMLNPQAVSAQSTGTVTASTLNVRQKASTTAKITQSEGQNVFLKKNEKVTILGESGKWYNISMKFLGKTVKGYIHSDYIKVNKTNSKRTGVVTANSLNVRKAAGTKQAVIGSLAKNKKVTIYKEVTRAGVKWYEINFKDPETKKNGYVSSEYIKLGKISNPTPKPKPTPKPTPTPTPTPDPKPIETVTEVNVKGRIVVNSSLNVRKGPGTNYGVSAGLVKDSQVIIVDETMNGNKKWYKIEFLDGKLKKTGYVSSDYAKIDQKSVKSRISTNGVKVRKNAGNKYANLKNAKGNIISLKTNKAVVVRGEITIGSTKWFEVTFKLSGTTYRGFIPNNNVSFGRLSTVEEPVTRPEPTPEPTPEPDPTPEPTPEPTPPLTNQEFENALKAEGFPESYIKPLLELHKINPHWKFEAYHTNLQWNTVIKEEGVPGRNLLPNNKSIEWKSLQKGAYDWSRDAFAVFDGSTWVTASKEAIEYYMDPRNFLTESGIFQFELLRYHEEYQNISGVEDILSGTAMHKTQFSFDDGQEIKAYTYGKAFIDAAKYSGVSPYHLASRVKQEVVTGPTTLSNSVTGKVKGFEGLYNFFNIGAFDSTNSGGAVANGLNYARNGVKNQILNNLYLIPWTNPHNSILGGAYIIGQNYIKRGQDTVYLQKFNVTPLSTYYNQYMSNVEAPFAEAKKIEVAYRSMVDTPIVFSIPVYLNMPSTNISVPAKKYNPNNRLRNLKVEDQDGKNLIVTPTFDQETKSYSLIVPKTVDYVIVSGTAVSNKATIKGTGKKDLTTGNNILTVTVTAENGDKDNYVIKVVKEK